MEPKLDDVVDFQRQVSIAFLKSTVGYAVRTPRGQKDPGAIKWDPKLNSRDKSNETIQALERTTDNLGVHLFGPLVDVDIDTDNPMLLDALDYFLPHTAHVWGRKSRPRTHRLYELSQVTMFDPTIWPFLAKVQAIPDIAVEVRGGELKSARYSLLPGSIHPSGEHYQWEDAKAARNTSVVHVSESKLMQAVRFACAATLVGKYWQEGVRNELCKAFSGFMFRASCYAEELNTDVPFTQDDAWELLQGVMSIADDDPADKAMRKKTFDQTWEKGLSGAPVTGATRIADITGDKEIVGMLYTLLANTPDLQLMDKLFDQFAVIRNTMNLVDLELGSKGSFVMNKDAFVFTLAGNYITTPKGRVPMSAVFLHSQRRTIVDRLAVNPAREKVYNDHDGLKVANTWSGWAIPPADTEVTTDEVAWFTDYLKRVVCRNDLNLYEWALMWIADIFQNPSEKPGTALVLVGGQGAGKSVLFESIIRPIIGSAHSAKAGTVERLTSKFNSTMGGKLFILGEEVMNSNRKVDADALKDAITSKRRAVEMKGRDVFEMEDCARYGFTSNHVNKAVNVEVGDRRYTIAEVSDEYEFKDGRNDAKRNPFFDALYSHLEEVVNGETVPNTGELSKLHRYFLQVPVNRVAIRSAYNTDVKKATQMSSSRGFDAWLLAMVDWINPLDNVREIERGEGHSFHLDTKNNRYKATQDWPDFINYGKLELSLRLHSVRDYGEARSAQQIAKFFKDNGLVGSTDDRQVRFGDAKVRVRPMPDRIDIIKYLRARGFDVLDVNDTIDENEKKGPEF